MFQCFELFCIDPSHVSHLSLGDAPIDSLWVPVRKVCCPINHSNLMVTGPGFDAFGSVRRLKVLLENKVSISIKLVLEGKHKLLQNVLVDGCIDSGLTVDQHQQMI